MLRRDVVEAARTGRFHIYAVDTIDEAASLLTGVEAGVSDGRGEFTEGTLNARVASRLREMSELQQKEIRERIAGTVQ
jgi:predicted ATP-dependent protease